MKYALRTLICLLLLFGLLFVVSGTLRQKVLGGVFEWIIISRHQTSHPVSKEKAEKYFRPGYLPVSSHDIQYASAYCQISPTFETFIRFEAPIQDCMEHAISKYPEFALKPIERAFQPEATMGVNADWFDTGKIKHGLVGGSKEGGCATIWIDTDRGIFYFHQTD